MTDGNIDKMSIQEVTDVEMKCGGCVDSTDEVEAFCCQCAEFICKECVKNHKRMKAFATHEIHSLEDLKEGRVRESHEDQDILPDNTTPDNSVKLVEKLSLLKPVAAHFSSIIKDVQTIKLDTEINEDLMVRKLQRDFTELHQMLDERKSEVFRQALRKLRDKEAGKTGSADMGVEVRCDKALQQLCLAKANITQLAVDDSAQCTVRGEGTKTAEVNVTSQVILTTTSSTCKIDSSVVVVGQLKSLYNGSVIKCDIDQSEPGEYRIQYTPTVRGRHELTVSVDGQQVAGSPFSVFVSIHPTQLGKPVKVWKDIKDAIGITVNAAGDVIVSEYEGNIVKLEARGKATVLLKLSDIKLEYLESIATDKEDNFYCTDSSSNKIMKYNKNKSNIQVFEVEQLKGPGHHGVAVVEDEVMLCECGNEGTIMIYNRELKYIRRIAHKRMGKAYSVSPDSHSNLYVSDRNNSCIHFFTNDGIHLHSFGTAGHLNGPHSLCVSYHYVYVSNWTSHSVSVFTTTGEYVTSFGQYGDKEGDLNSPCGVCTDKDGFLYVAEYWNNRVQCF